MASLFKSAREYLTPVLAESAFVEKGVLTPEEFVAAGDQLVQQFPTWEWCAGDETRRKPYLPPHKQYLLTRNVPCRRRARCLEMKVWTPLVDMPYGVA
jgi:ubiquitin-like-conjugating enzyme ATG3